MSEEERAARRNEGKRAKRAEAKQREEAEARAAAQRVEEVSEVVYELIEDVVKDWMMETHPRLDELNEWLGEDGDVSETEFDDSIVTCRRARRICGDRHIPAGRPTHSVQGKVPGI